MNRHLNEIGYALGGNPGASLARFLGMQVSASTLLRIVLAMPEPEYTTPRIMGIDDWAFRKGHNYGTILVDLEKRKPIDLLPDREVETVKCWLQHHPGIEVISRDRASNYAEAARNGAPDAVQVADRWHLLKNLGDALKRMLNTYHKELQLAATDIAQAERDEKIKQIEKSRETTPGENEQQPSSPGEPSMAKYELIFQEVKKLQSEGASKKSVIRQLGLHGETVRKYWKYDEYPKGTITPAIGSKAYQFEVYLRKRWDEGERNRKELWREIKEQGFTGSFQSVYRLTDKFPQGKDRKTSSPPLAIRIWSAKKVSILLGAKEKDWTSEEQEFLEKLFRHFPAAKNAHDLALQFKAIANERKSDQLDPWLEAVRASGINTLKNFAKGLKQDYEAVKAAMTVCWSNGQVEGQVNRLKNIKRQMYGRASFSLQRKRVLMDSS